MLEEKAAYIKKQLLFLITIFVLLSLNSNNTGK